MGKYVIKADKLVCDAVYLNPLTSFNQWYTHYEEENKGKTTVRLSTVILTKGKVKPINDFDIPSWYSNNQRGGTIRLGSMYVGDESHD